MVSEKEKTGPDSESAVDLRKDQAFKELIHDGYILAAIIGGVIPEFKGRTRDEILKCLQTGANGRYVKGRDTESVSSENGPIIRDSVFDVKLIIADRQRSAAVRYDDDRLITHSIDI